MLHTMTSLERTRTVLAGGIPDRIPVDLHNFMMVAETSGAPFPEFSQDGAAMAEGQIKAWREFGHDVLLLENGTGALAEACGAQVEYMEGSAPVCHGPAIKSLDDSDKLVVPDPYKVYPLTENLKATRIVAPETFQRVERHWNTNEVFILTAGQANLILFDGVNERPGKPFVIPVQRNVAYNVGQSVWRHVVMSPDAHIVLFER